MTWPLKLYLQVEQLDQQSDCTRRSLSLRIAESAIRRSAQMATRMSLLPFQSTHENIIRYQMYRQLAVTLADLEWNDHVRALSISGSGPLTKMACAHADVVDADYPEHNMLDLQFEDESFDLVVSDQVLEHLEGDPFKAVSESFRVLKPGGIAVHATVFMYQIHGYPSDFWRFTPDSLSLLCREFSEIITVNGWGNRYVPILNWLGLIDGFSVPRSAWHPYSFVSRYNEWRYPVVTWIVARK